MLRSLNSHISPPGLQRSVSFMLHVWQLSWTGAAAWQLLLFGACQSKKHPYKCYCAHLIDLSQAQSSQTGRLWRGMAGNARRNKQASQCPRRRRLGRRWLGGTLGLARWPSSDANSDISWLWLYTSRHPSNGAVSWGNGGRGRILQHTRAKEKWGGGGGGRMH